MTSAQQLATAILESDSHEAAYAELQTLFAKRDALQKEQAYVLAVEMTLRRLGYSRKQIKSYDVRSKADGSKQLVGFWLKKGDYPGKIRRRQAAKAAAQAANGAALVSIDDPDPDNPVPYWKRKERLPRHSAPNEFSAYYVPIDPPLRVPAHLA